LSRGHNFGLEASLVLRPNVSVSEQLLYYVCWHSVSVTTVPVDLHVLVDCLCILYELVNIGTVPLINLLLLAV